MNTRKSWILAFVVTLLGAVAFIYISGLKQPPKQGTKAAAVIAPYFLVKNESLPLKVTGSGQVRAKNRIDLYAEVNGLLQTQKMDFRTGMQFNRGETLISIDDSEQRANLYAQRSEYQNLITSLLPDIKLEFPNEKDKWNQYLNSIVIEQPIPVVPATNSDKEKFFVTGRKVFSSYYNLKNLEAHFNKYVLKAPYNGVVTESLINPGGLVRSGQKLGTFSNLDLFEIAIAIPAEDARLISVGNEVELYIAGQPEGWQGKVVRISPAIDLNTQTVAIFIESTNQGLREGMFPTASINCGSIDQSMEIPRNLLIENKWVYFVDHDSTLQRVDLNPLRYQEKSVITNLLKDGTKILAKNIPGSFIGMKVLPQKED
ncbi:MAG: efflux transporter periplasmic adaptor subunit [Bacteroidetes bacterium CG18_big_fil_WC_8_21_14_2_50_41_14]|nr:MAG: efflux transporter periplasmic adaptor subunit [Bacteroidetes bacterium CG18_big_fil_WC_8_21_14_2_50_41_14]PJB59882.1 MAG: efflux transporter periplasmic adaptor subunit [Bacteroidetes bacterium CG_4_9_14_3_um_filter_41_19]